MSVLAVDVPALLVPPTVGHAALRLPDDWRTWDRLFRHARDTINDFLSVVDKVPGIELGRLPEGDLADLVVKPLCGDWDRIRAKGLACRSAAEAMAGVSRNVALVPLHLADAWCGAAALSAGAHLGAYAAATRGMAEVVHLGRVAFDRVAWMSCRLGEVVIRLLVPLGRLLVRIAAKVARRFGGWVAWARTSAEVLVEGLEPVRDIYDDVRTLLALVDDVIALHGLVRDWVQEARDALSVLRSLPSLVDALPRLGHPGRVDPTRWPGVATAAGAAAHDALVAGMAEAGATAHDALAGFAS